LEVRRALAAEQGAGPTAQLDVARNLLAIGRLLEVTARTAETREALDEAGKLARAVRARAPGSEDALAVEGNTLGALARLLLRSGQPAELRHQRTRKRGSSRVLGEAELAGSRPAGEGGGLDWLASGEPTPEFAALLEEQYRRLLEVLPEPSLRDVARLRLEGYTSEEIAGQLGCNSRTITRKLELIRRTWSETPLP
jgi:DNA-directed RNA polymerase specialized sigma24 family protein